MNWYNIAVDFFILLAVSLFWSWRGRAMAKVERNQMVHTCASMPSLTEHQRENMLKLVQE